MSGEFYEFTGRVTSVDFFNDKFYIAVTKKLFDACSDPNHLIVIDQGVEFWTTNLRDIYYAYTAFMTKKDGTFTIPRDQLVDYWSIPKER